MEAGLHREEGGTAQGCTDGGGSTEAGLHMEGGMAALKQGEGDPYRS